jgi:hypothetical protein
MLSGEFSDQYNHGVLTLTLFQGGGILRNTSLAYLERKTVEVSG